MLEKLEKILSIEKKEHQYDWEKVEDSYEINFQMITNLLLSIMVRVE